MIVNGRVREADPYTARIAHTVGAAPEPDAGIQDAAIPADMGVVIEDAAPEQDAEAPIEDATPNPDAIVQPLDAGVSPADLGPDATVDMGAPEQDAAPNPDATPEQDAAPQIRPRWWVGGLTGGGDVIEVVKAR